MGTQAPVLYGVFLQNESGCILRIGDGHGRDVGDCAAQAVIDRYCEYVAAGFTDLVNALAPEMILLGGGISRQGERILAPIREYVVNNCFGQKDGAVPIIAAAKLGNEAGIIGAAAL